MPFANVNEIQIYYEVFGEGPPILMIQGLSANTDWWNPRLTEGLSEELKVIQFDNRGAGRTRTPSEDFSIELLAEDVSNLMDSLGFSSAHVLGISMGGMIAQELVLNHPEKVDNLILCSTTCGGPESVQASEEVLETLSLDRSNMEPEQIIERMLPLLFTQEFINNNPDLIELAKKRMLKNPISEEDFKRQLQAIMYFDTCDRLSKIESSTLILHGKEDILIPPKNGKILNEAIQNSKLVYFENSAHGLMEEMEKVVKNILKFLPD